MLKLNSKSYRNLDTKTYQKAQVRIKPSLACRTQTNTETKQKNNIRDTFLSTVILDKAVSYTHSINTHTRTHTHTHKQLFAKWCSDTNAIC